MANAVRPKLLDLFYGAGGCAVGYHRAGFDVVGVDRSPQKRYPFPFMSDDAINTMELLLAGGSVVTECGLELPIDSFAVIHASPPCQSWSVLRHLSTKQHPQLIDPVRGLLVASGKPWVIENVVGAPLLNPIRLCGSSFGLDLRRHRLFESNFPLIGKACDHAWQTPRFPANRSDRRKSGKLARVIVVAGHDTRKFNHLASIVSVHGGTQGLGGVAEWRRAMGIDWMTRDELAQAIPPAYTEYVGR